MAPIHEVARTISKLAAAKTSRLFIAAMTRRKGRNANRPISMKPPTATMAVANACKRSPTSSNFGVLFKANNGAAANIGATAKSWNNRAENTSLPCLV